MLYEILRKYWWGLLLLAGCAKPGPPGRPLLTNPVLDRKLTRLLHFSVPLISVGELQRKQEKVHIFDAREWEEFSASHIPGARFAGYRDFDVKSVSYLSRDSEIVVYCSVGYRSEKVGEKLLKAGYQQVHNLYGGIFEWADKGWPLEDERGTSTVKLHTYNASWSQYPTSKDLVKIW